MRRPQYISPSAYAKYKKDKELYYIEYLAERRPDREPQTEAMAIGSAFDAYVKSAIAEAVFGRGVKTQLEFESLFERAVEPHVRDRARVDGAVVFELYKSSGSLADLLTQLHSDVEMEFEVRGTIIDKSENGLVLLGKPDLSFKTKDGTAVLLDWKVNGAYSKYNVSPMKGYTQLRGPGGSLLKPHKECVPGNYKGLRINLATTLEQLNETWAEQLSVYGWLCGMDVGSEFIVMIDQIAGPLGSQRIAEHRLLIGRTFQTLLHLSLVEMWETIRSDHYFRDMSIEDSKARCLLLEEAYQPLDGATEDLFGAVKKQIFRGI